MQVLAVEAHDTFDIGSFRSCHDRRIEAVCNYTDSSGDLGVSDGYYAPITPSTQISKHWQRLRRPIFDAEFCFIEYAIGYE